MVLIFNRRWEMAWSNGKNYIVTQSYQHYLLMPRSLARTN